MLNLSSVQDAMTSLSVMGIYADAISVHPSVGDMLKDQGMEKAPEKCFGLPVNYVLGLDLNRIYWLQGGKIVAVSDVMGRIFR